ncbi:hypothetical protein BpHYR1_016599 [Brachionus plicatilis]|uniref:Uncharacterized protein n=1 Tax=Brachionus plicatilis TaxID=10195 RepID=A0A3M7SKQ2_BRAPC|nr:hypothetical protein BpHYR1_016599 [Brachionus plicatilis]
MSASYISTRYLKKTHPPFFNKTNTQVETPGCFWRSSQTHPQFYFLTYFYIKNHLKLVPITYLYLFILALKNSTKKRKVSKLVRNLLSFNPKKSFIIDEIIQE